MAPYQALKCGAHPCNPSINQTTKKLPWCFPFSSGSQKSHHRMHWIIPLAELCFFIRNQPGPRSEWNYLDAWHAHLVTVSQDGPGDTNWCQCQWNNEAEKWSIPASWKTSWVPLFQNPMVRSAYKLPAWKPNRNSHMCLSTLLLFTVWVSPLDR